MTTLTSYIMSNPLFDSGGADFLATNFAGKDAPKSRFLFTMVLGIRPDSSSTLIQTSENGARELNQIKFALKSATRPNPTIEYADVNMYGYRTKVKTKIDFGTVTVVMYDDSRNTAHDLFNDYFTQISPITSVESDQFSTLSGDEVYETSIGPLSSKYGEIEYIKIFHHYNADPDGGLICYTYANPKLVTAELDALDMSSSDAPLITLTFNYDFFKIENLNDESFEDLYGTVGNVQQEYLDEPIP